MNIAIIAGVRFTVAEPSAGGMERHTDVLARALCDRSRRVTAYAGHGTDVADADAPYRTQPPVEEPLDVSPAPGETPRCRPSNS